MKKKLSIVLLTIVSLSSMTYGYFQKERADEQAALAIENAEMAREAENIADQYRKKEEMARMNALDNQKSSDGAS